MDIGKIMDILPHRYPFLLVDRVQDLDPGRRVVALKNVTINEPFFAGHFPGHPIMPGVLIVEAMAQAGGLMLMDELMGSEPKVVYLMSLDGVKFRRPVTPGDQLILEVEMVQARKNTCKMKGLARVEDQVAVEATMMARIMER